MYDVQNYFSCTPIVELGGKGHEQGQLYYPYGVTITQQGNLLVSDQVKKCLIRN